MGENWGKVGKSGEKWGKVGQVEASWRRSASTWAIDSSTDSRWDRSNRSNRSDRSERHSRRSFVSTWQLAASEIAASGIGVALRLESSRPGQVWSPRRSNAGAIYEEKSRFGKTMGATSDQTYSPRQNHEEIIFTHIDAAFELRVSREEFGLYQLVNVIIT